MVGLKQLNAVLVKVKVNGFQHKTSKYITTSMDDKTFSLLNIHDGTIQSIRGITRDVVIHQKTAKLILSVKFQTMAETYRLKFSNLDSFRQIADSFVEIREAMRQEHLS